MTEMMLCGACLAPGQFELTSVPLPLTAPEGWVLVDIAAAGLCGTDYHIYAGKHPYLNYPRVIGHELSGRVAVAGAGWDQGVAVVINPYISCGTCRACQRGKPNCCTRIEVLGVHRDGGICARIAIPAGNLYPAGDLPLEAAAMVEFLAIGAHAVRRGEVTAADRVLVTGAGPIGLGAALFAKARGAEVHLLDTTPARLEQAAALGFAHLHAAIGPDHAEGFDVVLDATGHAGAIEAGFAHVAHGGTYVLISVVQDRISFSDPEFHKREMRLIGSRNATAEDFEVVMAALRSGAVKADALLSERIALADLPARLAELAADRGRLIKAIVTLKAAP
ncbi:MAG: zinc-binding alcohol dehydrogenase family protein [Cypionkella sp.]|uniref:zinc-binding alcohol dehydrogenase family protein n=1 Tax=Cypionkella sp. TaxID=2811411 RepID=UPI002ABC9727|nr:zinc-binding alcohol dehydrogenase family protein [Cypionkella sp.]MDZ4312715.1 zinc-binding alcohol dehydrogenase family protein [Cypionkella sp.]MDZ4392748.1 zinc-binding alcohol dehydrogenase family protein [Cypionkella sp.]